MDKGVNINEQYKKTSKHKKELEDLYQDLLAENKSLIKSMFDLKEKLENKKEEYLSLSRKEKILMDMDD